MNKTQLQAMEADPRFAQLSYNEQIDLRSKGFLNVMGTDPRFAQITAPEKELLLRKYAYRPPVFEDQRLNVLSDGVRNRVESGDEDFLKRLSGLQAGQGLASGVIGNALTNLFGAISGESGQLMALATAGPENEKFSAYVGYLSSRDEQVAKLGNTLKSIGSGVSFVADIAAMYMNPAMKAMRVGLGTWGTAKAAQTSSRALGFLARTAIPVFTEVTIEGMLGVVRDNIQDYQQGRMDERLRGGIAKQFETFGEWAAIDYLIELGLHYALPIASNLKHIFFKGVSDRALRKNIGMTAEELADTTQAWLKGDINETTFKQLNTSVQDHLTQLNSLTQAKALGAEIVNQPFLNSVTGSSFSGKTLVALDDGTFRLGELHNSKEAKVFETLREVNEELAESVSKRLADTTDEAQKLAETEQYQWLLNYKTLGEGIDSSIDIVKRSQEIKGDLGIKLKKTVGRMPKDFVPINKRGIISNGEAGMAEKVGNVIEKITVPEAFNEEALSKGASLFDNSGPVKFDTGGTNNNAVVVLNNPANKEALDNAIAKTSSSAMQLPEGMSSEQAAQNLLIERGFDGIDLKDGTITSFFGDRVKVISENLNGLTGKLSNMPTTKVKNTILEPVTKPAEVIERITPAPTVPPAKVSDTIPSTGLSTDTNDYVKIIARKAGATITQVGKDFVLKLGKSLPPIKLNSMKEALDALTMLKTTPASLRTMLKAEGKELLKVLDANGNTIGFKILKGKEVLGQGNTLRKAMLDAEFVPKIPIENAPTNNIIETTGEKFIAGGDSVIGSNAEIRKALSAFGDSAYTESLITKVDNSKAKVIQEANGQMKVIDKRLEGVIQTKDDLRSAMKTVSNFDEFENLQNISRNKGMELTIKNGQYHVLDQSGSKFVAKNLDELTNYWKTKVPDPEVAPDLFGKGNEAVNEGAATVKGTNQGQATKPKNWAEQPEALPIKEGPGKPKMSWWLSGTSALRPLRDWLISATKKAGLPDLLQKYRNVDRSLRAATVEIDKGNQIILDIMSPKGKLIGLNQRKSIYYYLADEVDTGRLINKVTDTKFEYQMTDETIEIANKLREVFGIDETSGLFAKFGINPQKYLGDYAPRVREWHELNPDKVNHVTMKQLTDELWSDGVPKEIKFWAEEERASEFINMAIDDDIFMVMTKYNTQGHKKLFVEEAWTDLQDYMTKNQAHIPQEIAYRIQDWRASVMHIRMTDGEKMVKNFLHRFSMAIAPNSPKTRKIIQDMTQTMYQLNITTNMGWRPWLAARNMLQPYTTLAPRWGNDVVNQAVNNVAKNTKEIIGECKRLGIINTKDPILFAESIDATLNTLTHRGLKMFGRSDDITRAIGFETARIQWKDGLAKLKSGVIKNPDDFLKVTGVNLMPDDIQTAVMRQLDLANPDVAFDLYANEVVAESFFIYRSDQAPTMYKGLIGKAFGQYGTYSAGFREMLKNGFTRGTKAQKFAFGARYMANTVAIGGALAAVGINNNNFIPFAPASFTGGPMFDLGMTAIQATDLNSFNGRRARAELFDKVPSLRKSFETGELRHLTGNSGLIPGWFQLKAIDDFAAYSKQGKGFQAWLALTSTPIHPDMR